MISKPLLKSFMGVLAWFSLSIFVPYASLADEPRYEGRTLTENSQGTISDPGIYVIDQASLIETSTQQRLEHLLADLDHKAIAQVKVLTVPTTGGEDVFTFVKRHAESWQLGEKGKDNGVLIALALKERHVRVHTGDGLESALPDAYLGTITRFVANQYLKKGNYSAGLSELTIAVVNKLAESQHVKFKEGMIRSLGPWYFLNHLYTDPDTGTRFYSMSPNRPKKCHKNIDRAFLYVEVPDKEMIADNVGAKLMMEKVASLFEQECGAHKPGIRAFYYNVYLFPNGYDIGSVAHGGKPSLPDDNLAYGAIIGEDGRLSLGRYRNYVLEAKERRKALEAKKAKEAKKKERLEEFVKKNGISKWVSPDELSANPFIYNDKAVGFVATFSTMISKEQAIFVRNNNTFLVSDVPSDKFKKRSLVLLAATVLGKKHAPIGNKELVTHLRFMDVRFCEDSRCRNIFPVK